MQINNKFLFTLAGLITLGFTACNKPDKISLPTEGKIYMAQAAGTRSTIDLALADTAQIVNFGAAYGGLQFPGSDINVAFKLDTGLVAAYNAAHNTSYIVMPEAAYTISGFAATIKAGTISSDALQLSILSKSLIFGTHYILPITLATASGGNIDSSLRTSYFIVDTITRKSVDITTLGTLSVNRENGDGSGAGEGSPKVVDGDLNTKYLNNYNPDMYIQLKYATPFIVGAYTLTSGGDADGRDPKDWNLSGSNDGTTWTVVDNRESQSFSGRNQTIRFETSTPAAYTYYRFNVTANNGEDLFQMSEIRLIQYQ